MQIVNTMANYCGMCVDTPHGHWRCFGTSHHPTAICVSEFTFYVMSTTLNVDVNTLLPAEIMMARPSEVGDMLDACQDWPRHFHLFYIAVGLNVIAD